LPDDHPFHWRNEFGRYRFTYLAGLREVFVRANALHNLNTASVRDLIKSGIPCNKSIDHVWRLLDEADLAIYPGTGVTQSNMSEKTQKMYGHRSFHSDNLTPFVLTQPMNFAKAAMVERALSNITAWPGYLASAKRPTRDLRLAIHSFEDLKPLKALRNTVAERIFLARRTGQLKELTLTPRMYQNRDEIADVVRASASYAAKKETRGQTKDVRRPARQEMVITH